MTQLTLTQLKDIAKVTAPDFAILDKEPGSTRVLVRYNGMQGYIEESLLTKRSELPEGSHLRDRKAATARR